jgi:hypothetical protein
VLGCGLNRSLQWRTLGWSKTLKAGIARRFPLGDWPKLRDEFTDSPSRPIITEENAGRLNAKRGTSLETTNGCPGGEKL